MMVESNSNCTPMNIHPTGGAAIIDSSEKLHNENMIVAGKILQSNLFFFK
jgi:hypothetical protein